MSITMETTAEKKAVEAENLPAFHGIKLVNIKRNVTEALALIGRDGLFGQYTRHDISHADELIKIAEWLIPEETKVLMTKAEWLLLVLSFYFHDFGMIITNKEYAERDTNSNFLKFKNSIEKSDAFEQFNEKLNELQDKDKFIYQEFVRATHSLRVKEWIEGSYSCNGNCSQLAEIKKLISSLPIPFRRDLALVCRSHQTDDIDDFSLFNTDSHYGNEPDEKANVHYIAIILRTADLLHITKDRTPSIQYSL